MKLHGYYDPKFEAVAEKVARQIQFYGGGAAAAVFVEGEPVVDIWGGEARADGTPWGPDTMSISYSSTKGAAVTVLHALASDGALDYDAPVAHYWPEFGQQGKARITVRELLSHQAGLHKTLPLMRRAEDVLDWPYMVSQLEQAEPSFQPGTANGYQFVTFGWLVGELIQRVTGRPFTEVVRERIAEPLGLDGFYIGTPSEQLHRVADCVGMPAIERIPSARPGTRSGRRLGRRGRWIPSRRVRKLLVTGGFRPDQLRSLYARHDFWTTPIPAMNGVFTARSLAKMYAALAEGGALAGVRIAAPEIVSRASEVQTTRFDRVVGYPLRWRLGYHRADAAFKDVPEAFGHFGLAGAGGWANPERRMAAALVHNGNPLNPISQARVVWVTAAVYQALGAYPGALRTIFSDRRIRLMPEPV